MRRKSGSTTTWWNNRRRSAFRRGGAVVSRWIVAVLLLPVAWAAIVALGHLLSAVGAGGAGDWWRYVVGAVFYAVMERVFTKPVWLYVVGHELTHAASGVLSGARIYSIRASGTGGEVQLSKSNGFIALSPYVVPFYALTVLGLYAALRHWWDEPWLRPAFQFSLGAALAFHISHTISALHLRQSDLKVMGFFLSGVLIVMGNALVFGILVVGLFARAPSAQNYGKDLLRETRGACSAINIGTRRAWLFLQNWYRSSAEP